MFGAGGGRGRLWLEEADGRPLVCGSVDADDRPEFVLEILDGAVRLRRLRGRRLPALSLTPA